ncbi:hypothetical protein DWB64_13245 [Fusibacter sp. A1]|nr:hypothetical protein DWB64_13245 [Fusibacter sp. A1]
MSNLVLTPYQGNFPPEIRWEMLEDQMLSDHMLDCEEELPYLVEATGHQNLAYGTQNLGLSRLRQLENAVIVKRIAVD